MSVSCVCAYMCHCDSVCLCARTCVCDKLTQNICMTLSHCSDTEMPLLSMVQSHCLSTRTARQSSGRRRLALSTKNMEQVASIHTKQTVRKGSRMSRRANEERTQVGVSHVDINIYQTLSQKFCFQLCYRNGQVAAVFGRHLYLRRCFSAWQTWTRRRVEKKELENVMDQHRQKMSALLEAAATGDFKGF